MQEVEAEQKRIRELSEMRAQIFAQQEAADTLENPPETTLNEQEPVKASEPVEASEDSPWGWWSIFAKQEEQTRLILSQLPPRDSLEGLADETHGGLTERLGAMGAALGYMHAEQGTMLGRLRALKETYDTAMDAAKARLPRADIKPSTSEAAKLQLVMARPDSEPLRDLKRRIVELEACTGTQDGFIRSYTVAWETLSRALTSKTGEMAMEARR